MRSAIRSVITGLILLTFAVVLIVFANKGKQAERKEYSAEYFWLLASEETKDLEPILKNYARRSGIKIQIEYTNTSDIVDKLNHSEKYDAVWLSNSIWLHLIDQQSQIKESKSIAISPIVFGIKQSVAESLNMIETPVSTSDILKEIENKRLTFAMTNPMVADATSSMYLAYYSLFSGSNHLTEDQIINPVTKTQMQKLLSGVDRVSGTNEYLNKLAVKNTNAVITYESSLIQINQTLIKAGSEPYILIYPTDGVALANFPFAYIDQNDPKKQETFYEIQNFLLSEEGRNELNKTGRRAWFGGTTTDVDLNIFSPNWGIHTDQPFHSLPYPDVDLIPTLLKEYQEVLKKPTHTVFVLDYSGSMIGTGNKELMKAMEELLEKQKSEANGLSFSSHDKITIIPFNSHVLDPFQTENGAETAALLDRLRNIDVTGQTNFFSALDLALNLLVKETDQYQTTIVLMTDGKGSDSSFTKLEERYQKIKKKIPIYTISYGQASEKQLKQIADLSNGKFFNGSLDLVQTFKQVRSYY